MKKSHFHEEPRRTPDSFTDDEISSLGVIWASIMTLIALIQLSLAW